MRQKQEADEATSNTDLTTLVLQIPSSVIADRRIFNSTSVQGLQVSNACICFDESIVDIDEIHFNIYFVYLSEINFLSNI